MAVTASSALLAVVVAPAPITWGHFIACQYGLASVVTWGLFGFDKYRARSAGSRIPEWTLHGIAAVGGWPGALLGQWMFRHKHAKPAFQTILRSIVAIHVVGGFAWVIWRFS